ncbi:bifunctional DNA primase/polymerase [Leucobacter allii]|uniref:bifunctional DNA primase/polymerase n=1 Tax=Leucobacter allii TaxID=2932247 RepID=UPI001FD1B828|nr:bifunctional DNA primase/polymerase [Leucobacter allii]UOR02371.1 bifunctional DNA primase/polymerase [Leucobacter allii]
MSAAQLLTPVAGMMLADAAQHYASQGVPVFPCVPGEKRPLVAHGFYDATADPVQVTAWWQRWPDANIGIPTGPTSGLEVVDVDVKGDPPRGPESWQRAAHAGLLDGWIAHVVTPSGGLHIYYPVAETEQRSWASGTAQLDFRGTAGYIVAPPSRTHLGGEAAAYQLLELSPNPARPVDAGALREFLDPRPPRASWQSRPFHGTLEERTQRIAAWLSGRGESERNQGLYWASCRLAENGASLSDAFEALAPVAEDIGLPPREIERTIRSAYRGPTPSAADHGQARQGQARREPASRGRVLA